jgi:NarL family two-component system response regulator YdfI
VTRVLIGASSKVVRVELASLLTTDPTFQVVGSFSVEDALAQFGHLQPDVVLLSLGSVANESISAAVESGSVPVGSKLVVLTEDAESFLAGAALRSSVRAILPRDAKAEEIFAAIEACVAGLIVIHPDLVDALLDPTDAEKQSGLTASDQILSPREIEVVRMIADGLGNKEIASKLGISDQTVKFHISTIFAKLGAANRAEAVTLGIRLGLIMV